ncbi:WD40/YVTN repeat-like-containing domain [Plasmopara halstedii]|uniref:WD40/YVTN repeat-like-containing domain n=1 Tax=Plasmopara halstedii TaxID=4781 RepID=A0A0P1AMJ1_PLAHL|nr:WD40/YVTN repeat-like-containing domain [Plasmopara halstedii]CEG42236.1 WD40/YVTN repeat-like-containing domain [Plasmopara halstedii]|eukprot:XP_024578605.1 WD40/YVTN repeat-like-containing domain [Plasmopara halstedii]
MVLSLVPRQTPLVVIDEPTPIGNNCLIENAMFHPSRGSIVCVKVDTLEELDIKTGALLCHITFDLLASSNVESLLPAGSHFVVGVLQSRLFVIWDLNESVLLATVDTDKVHSVRRVTALATSLCADRWLFFNADGSNNVRVTRVDSPHPAREILRKSALRGGSVLSLAYSTEHHLLSSGCSDGTIQVWRISSGEVDAGSSRKNQELTSFATPLFAVQLTQSPVVEICIGRCTGCGINGSSSNMFLAVGYQNRRVDMITMNDQAHTCVASVTLAPPQTLDFSRLTGVLTFAIHPQLPVLLAHWRFHGIELGVDCIVAWEFVKAEDTSITSPRGGAGGNSSGGGTLSDWWNIPDSPTLLQQNVSYDKQLRSQVFATDVMLWQNSFAIYASTLTCRSILLVDIQGSAKSKQNDIKAVPLLSTTTQLTLAQYHDYPTDISSSHLQMTVTRSTKGTPVLKVQQFSQLLGRLIASSDQLPDWKSEGGFPLVPFQMLENHHRSAVCIKLREKGEYTATSCVRPSLFSFAVLDLEVTRSATASSDRVIHTEDEQEEVSLSSLPAIELKDGTLQHDARDVCFGMNPSIDNDITHKAQSYLLLILSKKGDAITLQTTRGQSFERVELDQLVQRVFATPLLLPPSSPYHSNVVCKLLYLLEPIDSAQPEKLVLSQDNLSVPVKSSTLWTCKLNEYVVNIQWNSSSCPHIGPYDSQQRLLLAVITTQRLVVLSSELRQLRSYDFQIDLLGEPESLLWVSQTLVYSAAGGQVRYVTPVANHSPEKASRLLCSLAINTDPRQGFSRVSIQLVSMFGDRLCYAITDPTTLSTRLTLHPVALCEPLLLGFAQPNNTLRRIFKREVLAFILMNDESDRPVCSISDIVISTAYHIFGWKNEVLNVLKALKKSHEKSSVTTVADVGIASVSSSNYNRTSHLSRAALGSIFFDAHKWEDFVRIYLDHDPALEEYVVTIGSDDVAKLPSKVGGLAQRFRQLAAVFESIGQPDWALRCLDLSGDDEALLIAVRKLTTGSTLRSLEILDNLRKTWTKLNPALYGIASAAMGQNEQHDPFSLLCCESLTQSTRRGRLLNSIAPLDCLRLTVGSTSEQHDDFNDHTHAETLAWKHLAPEDASEWIGISTKHRIATTDPRALNYSIFDGENSGFGGRLSNVEAMSPPALCTPSLAAASIDAAAGARLTIGPFQDEEDAVVAYWRFEEGATAADKLETNEGELAEGFECLDTSKRENSLRLFGVKLVESCAPVDRGEPGRIPEEFALRYPSLKRSTFEIPLSGWGAQCIIRPGSTLDIATTFDEDPYRREFTFEVWIRNYRMYEKIQKAATNDADISDIDSNSIRQAVVSRRRAESLDDGVNGGVISGSAIWELVIDEEDYLVLTFGKQQVRSSRKIEHNSNQGWHHVAFTIDVSSSQRVGVKLYLDACCVGETQTTPSNETKSKPSKLLLGWNMQDYEMTEVRLWATVRSADQLSDMRENYLGLAEAKRRMKIAIHQRNCTCEKCVTRRAQNTANAGAGVVPRLGLSLSTPLAPPSRQRRIVPQAKLTS